MQRGPLGTWKHPKSKDSRLGSLRYTLCTCTRPACSNFLLRLLRKLARSNQLILSKDVFAHALLQIFIQLKRSALCDLMNIAVSVAKITLASPLFKRFCSAMYSPLRTSWLPHALTSPVSWEAGRFVHETTGVVLMHLRGIFA